VLGRALSGFSAAVALELMMISMATAPSLSHGFQPQNMVNYHVISPKKSMVDQFTIIFQVFFDH